MKKENINKIINHLYKYGTYKIDSNLSVKKFYNKYIDTFKLPSSTDGESSIGKILEIQPVSSFYKTISTDRRSTSSNAKKILLQPHDKRFKALIKDMQLSLIKQLHIIQEIIDKHNIFCTDDTIDIMCSDISENDINEILELIKQTEVKSAVDENKIKEKSEDIELKFESQKSLTDDVHRNLYPRTKRKCSVLSNDVDNKRNDSSKQKENIGSMDAKDTNECSTSTATSQFCEEERNNTSGINNSFSDKNILEMILQLPAPESKKLTKDSSDDQIDKKLALAPALHKKQITHNNNSAITNDDVSKLEDFSCIHKIECLIENKTDLNVMYKEKTFIDNNETITSKDKVFRISGRKDLHLRPFEKKIKTNQITTISRNNSKQKQDNYNLCKKMVTETLPIAEKLQVPIYLCNMEAKSTPPASVPSFNVKRLKEMSKDKYKEKLNVKVPSAKNYADLLKRSRTQK
ncbi:hypothetical protein AAJ76_1100030560 [Vairimorpha ceranae]|uniref:Uncharacterized protein n=1 Tax=Vairimorpha ceranae TaxID=40302 RepID=A0A0F9ZE66_9MICR|nr:hypothetical protein AAJ76_1100030560 [Vairimorpha ceranae]KKO75819.1 hypothetical protein AAJ76_1100030560 [Vairimorpha ceranae]